MWEYLERNFNKGWCKYFSPIIILVSTETGAVTQRRLYRDLFNQNGMDFVTQYLLQKPAWWKLFDFSSRQRLKVGQVNHLRYLYLSYGVERTLIIFLITTSLIKSTRNLTLKNKYFLYFRILLKAGRLLLEKETSRSWLIIKKLPVKPNIPLVMAAPCSSLRTVLVIHYGWSF